jgi:peptide deformylase
MGSVVRCLVQAQTSGEFNTDILRRKGFDVNMRLFRDNSGYRNLVLGITMYMGKLMSASYTDYSKLSGISGANIGIPLNIVGVRATETFRPDPATSLLKDSIWFLINPKIVAHSEATRIVKSNCGSIRLPEKIKVRRYEWVEVEYCNIEGKNVKTKVEGPMACTLQHEIDHNMGILITEKEEKCEGSVSDRPTNP